MAGLNRMILTGRLAADPEMRYTQNEVPVTHFRVAVGRPSKNSENNVDFIRCTAWSGLAKICGDYLKKGSLIALEGRLQISSYEKNGEKRFGYDIVADNVQMLDNRFFKAASSANSEENLETIRPSDNGRSKAKKK